RERVRLVLGGPAAERLAVVRPAIAELARCSEVTISAAGCDEQALAAVVAGVDVYLPLAGLIDVEAERARLTKELEKAESDLEIQRRKLANESFVGKAPAAVVDGVRAREAELVEVAAHLRARLDALA
ncbi:MAG TPA: valine--tRNA ligase, partial [Armatimonadetes bacterium]|nr:valine--tRNA ligase [Armatimonadota bacterium]